VDLFAIYQNIFTFNFEETQVRPSFGRFNLRKAEIRKKKKNHET